MSPRRPTEMAIIVAITLCGCGDTRGEEVARVTAPDRNVDAVMYESSGFLTTTFDDIYVVPQGVAPAERHRVAQVAGASAGPGQLGVRLVWRDPHHLRVDADSVHSAALFQRYILLGGGVHVELALRHNESAEANGPPRRSPSP